MSSKLIKKKKAIGAAAEQRQEIQRFKISSLDTSNSTR